MKLIKEIVYSKPYHRSKWLTSPCCHGMICHPRQSVRTQIFLKIISFLSSLSTTLGSNIECLPPSWTILIQVNPMTVWWQNDLTQLTEVWLWHHRPMMVHGFPIMHSVIVTNWTSNLDDVSQLTSFNNLRVLSAKSGVIMRNVSFVGR